MIRLFVAYSYGKSALQDFQYAGFGNIILDVSHLPSNFEDINRITDLIKAENKGFLDNSTIAILTWIKMN